MVPDIERYLVFGRSPSRLDDPVHTGLNEPHQCPVLGMFMVVPVACRYDRYLGLDKIKKSAARRVVCSMVVHMQYVYVATVIDYRVPHRLFDTGILRAGPASD